MEGARVTRRAPYAFKASAERELARLPRHARVDFWRAVDLVLESPTRPRPGLDIRQIRGTKSIWRLRFGVYRALYQWDGRTVRFVLIEHRHRVYGRLDELGL